MTSKKDILKFKPVVEHYGTVLVNGKAIDIELPPYTCGHPTRKISGKVYVRYTTANTKKRLIEFAKRLDIEAYRIVDTPKKCGHKYALYVRGGSWGKIKGVS